jgi:signal transduction histidine kinase
MPVKRNFFASIIFLLLFPVTLLFGQAKFDSLYKAIEGKQDTAKFHCLSDMCWKYRYNDAQLALDAGAKALEIARKLPNKIFEARILNRIGVVFWWMNNYDLSMEYSRKALAAANEAKDSIEIGYAENNIGGTYQQKMYYTLAIEHILTALKIFEHLNFKPGIAYCSANVGAIFERQENYEKALEYFNRALRIRTETGDKTGRGLILHSIANMYLLNKSEVDAAPILNEVKTIAEQAGDKNLLAIAYSGLSKMEFSKKNYPASLDYQLKGLKLLREINNKVNETTSHIYLASVYAHLNKFNEAEEEFKYFESLPGNEKTENQILDYFNAKSVFYELKGDLKKSLYFSRSCAAVKDSISRHENIARADEVKAIDKYLNTKSQNIILQNNIRFEERQKKYLIVISVLMALTFLVIFWRYRAKKAANKNLKELNAMKDIFFGIIAHDLKNPFQSILGTTSLLLKEIDNLSKDEIRRMIETLEKSGQQTYRLLENLLYWSLSQTGRIKFTPERVNLSEIANETIALLSSSAASKSISINFNTNEGFFSFCDIEMIKLVFRNLVTNGIKYSLEGGSVNIDLKRNDGYIEISVSDNGIGMSSEIKNNLITIDSHSSTPGTNGEKGTGLGLILCKEFVEKNKGRLTIESEIGCGSKFIFTLPAVN